MPEQNLRKFPDEWEKDLADGREYTQNSKWWRERPEEFKKQYADQIILVFKQSVIFSGIDTEEAREKLRSLDDEMNQCYVRYIPQQPVNLTAACV